MKLLRRPAVEKPRIEPDLDLRIQQLISIAKALASEVETLQAEFSADHPREKPIDFDHDGIDFYREVERYEIELIKNALELCAGNQTHAAKFLTMKPTTLNAKMKHYGLHSVRAGGQDQGSGPRINADYRCG